MGTEIQKELVGLRRAILTLGASVESRVDQAFEAFMERNAEMAMAVRTGDKEIDRMEVDIEGECMRVLALLHPVASDLRLVLAVVRIDNDLERIADHAKSIAKRVLDLNTLPPIDVPASIYTMARTALEMLSDALRALSDSDAALAQRVRETDEIVDNVQKEIFAWAEKTIPENVDQTRTVIDVLSVVRSIERIADLSTNIAEDVIFITDGEVVRHTR